MNPRSIYLDRFKDITYAEFAEHMVLEGVFTEDVKQKFITNCNNLTKGGSGAYDKIGKCEPIYSAFILSESPEGKEFWWAVEDAFSEKYNLIKA